MVLIKAYQNTKEIFKNLTYDVTMTSLLKQWQISDLRETKKILYYSKRNDESFPKMQFFIEIESLNQKLWPFK